jgi:hypothetical protein
VLAIEDRFATHTLDELARRGHRLTIAEPPSETLRRGVAR